MANSRADRYEKFAREYVVDRNATRSAIAAGYSEKTATVQGSRLLSKANVRRRIDILLSKQYSKLELTAEAVIQEMKRIAFSNMGDFTKTDATGKPVLDFTGITRDQFAAVQEIREDTTGGSGDGERKVVIRTTVKLADKHKALESLMRHMGMFNDKLHVTGLEGLADRINQIRARKGQ